MKKIESIGVFAGGNSGENPAFVQDAYELGTLIAENGYQLVYGAGSAGLMGAVARGVMAKNGKIKAIATEHIFHNRLEDYGLAPEDALDFDDLLLTKNMDERKNALYDNSDVFIILPGGFGTFDELFTLIIKKYMKEVDKRIIMLNTERFWDIYVKIEDLLINSGLAKEIYKDMLEFVDTPEEALAVL